MKYIMTCVVASVVVLSGCSTFKADPNKTVEIPANKLDNIPQWYLAKDPDDTKFIVVTATDVSKDMQFAIDKATLNAKTQLAARLKSDVDSVTRESTLENAGSGSAVEREIDRVSKVRVKQAIGMFKRENIAVYKEGDVYRAYVQFKIATEDAKRLTQPAGTKQSREDKFKELDDEQKVSAVQPNTLQLLPVENEEYKKRREEAMKKPGAVVGQITLQ
jgi:outer membrane murein-binding lipoprotein Lpp